MLSAVRNLFTPAEDTTTRDTEPTPTADIPLDAAFDVLSTERRRIVIQYLNDEHHATARELATQIAAHENDCDPSDVDTDQRKRAYIALIQGHLDTLDDVGVITYDDTHQDATATPEIAGVAAAIDAVHDHTGGGK